MTEDQNYNDLIKRSKVKEVCSDQDVRMSGDFKEAVNDYLLYGITKAIKRARANGRRTVTAKDL